MTTLTRNLSWLTGLLGVFSGCSSPTAEFGVVHGRITFEGQSLANVQVTFVPEKSTKKLPLPISTGITDRDGNYKLNSVTGVSGAAVGEHCVVVEDVGGDAPSGNNSREAQDEKPPTDGSTLSRIPQRYSTAAVTPLRKVVTVGDNAINLELTR